MLVTRSTKAGEVKIGDIAIFKAYKGSNSPATCVNVSETDKRLKITFEWVHTSLDGSNHNQTTTYLLSPNTFMFR